MTTNESNKIGFPLVTRTSCHRYSRRFRHVRWYSRGQTIIELLVAFAISLIFLPALFTMFFVSRQGHSEEVTRIQAIALLRGSEDIVRNIREKGWDTFSTYSLGSAYHPVQSGNTWSLGGGSETIGGFTRSLVISSVMRNTSGVIVASGGTVDPSTRKVTVTISWTQPLTSQVSSTLYLTRHDNVVVIDTTDTDFTKGTITNTKVKNLEGGEVVLGNTGGYGDWCTPSLTITALDLPKSGVANAISAIQGQIAAGTGENASGVSYANILVSDPTYPTSPMASVSGTFDGYKTNDVFTEQNYAYLATDNNAKEVAIIDLTSKDASNKYSEAGYFNAPGNGNGTAVATSGNTGFMMYASTLYSFDLSSKSGSRAQLGSISLPATGQKMTIVGTKAYIVTSSTSAQLVIVNIANPSSMTITDSVGVSGEAGKGIFVNSSGTRAYIVTASSSTQREFFIINTDTTSASYKQVLGSYDTSGMDPKGVVTVSGPRAIVVGIGGEEYQVIDITTETTNPLPRCGGLQIDSGVNGISTVFSSSSGRAYSFMITGDASTELKIIEGGPGSTGTDYVLNGTFDSQVFDVSVLATGSAQAAFNRLNATISHPSSVTDISLRVAIADAVSGSCTDANYVFVGPDGTTSSSYTTTDNTTIVASIPFNDDSSGYENPARCFKYRAYLSTTDHTLTPQLKDVTVSFSP